KNIRTGFQILIFPKLIILKYLIYKNKKYPLTISLRGILSKFRILFLLFNFAINSAHKKTPPAYAGGVSNNELAMTYSHMGNPTLPSAQRGFTSEFGKGSGGSLLLLSPAQLFMDLFGSYLTALQYVPYFVPNRIH